MARRVPWPHRPGRPGRPGSWSLRARLLAALLALLATVSIIVGVVSVLALDRFLLGRLDDQLTAADGRSRTAFRGSPEGRRPGGGPTGSPDGHGPAFLGVPGQGEGTLGARLVGGVLRSGAVLSRAGTFQRISASQGTVLTRLPVDGTPHTRQLGGDLGDYRLLASRAPDGDVIVTGLPLRGVHAAVYRLAGVAGAVILAGLAVAGFAGAVIIRVALQPLRRVAATAGRVSELSLDRGDVALAVRVPDADTDPRTEVGQVGAALNRMLGHVGAALTARQASETRIRQFVADASHELRTPLSSIRGYAELTRRSRDSVPPDVAHALGRVESEATRMSTLVADLLLLARLDAGRAVEQAPVDLSQLLIDVVSDAHVAGPDHDWRLALPGEPVVVPGDAAGLHQVVANVLTNARTHTPPGTTVAVSLTEERSGGGPPRRDAVVRVTDDGPGIPAELLPEVFERFTRGDSSRSRALGSTGLGLAIVSAIVEAHDGTVSVTSRPGLTEVTCRLPLAASEVSTCSLPPHRTDPCLTSSLGGTMRP